MRYEPRKACVLFSRQAPPLIIFYSMLTGLWDGLISRSIDSLARQCWVRHSAKSSTYHARHIVVLVIPTRQALEEKPSIKNCSDHLKDTPFC